MYKVAELKYSQNSYKKILGVLKESIRNYCVKIILKDLKEADSWFDLIENVIKSKNDDFISYDIRNNEEVIGFMITRFINNKLCLIRHFFITNIDEREEIAYILLKEAIKNLRLKYGINKFNNAAFTFPNDYLANPLKKLGFSILKRSNLTLNLENFDRNYKLKSGYSFAPFTKEDLSKIAELYVEVYKNHSDKSFWEEIRSVPLYLEDLKNSWDIFCLKDCSLVIIDKNREIVGCCLTEIGNQEGEVIIQNIAIHDSYQRIGIGKALLSKVLEVVKRVGYKKVLLTVTEGNPAEIMYNNFGFKKFNSFNIITSS
ncbi:MAG: GNAT family N-acetyltransferase [Candidatus Thorarchaeota archaeon]